MSQTQRRNLTRLNTSEGDEKVTTRQASAVAESGDMRDHMKKLQQVTGTTKSLLDFLVTRIRVLSEEVPVGRGFEIVKEVRHRLDERRSAEDSLKPLRDYIEQEKKQFYAKHAREIEKMVRQRVEEGVKQRLPAILKEKLSQYKEHLKTNSDLTDKIKQAMAVTSARTANSVLCPNYLEEPVTLIPPYPPKWNKLTLGDLKKIRGPAAAELASDQGLTPLEDSANSELARARNLNMVLRYIGVQYQAIPSRNGLLLTSPARSRSH